MKKINLIYWNGENFGDALSPALVREFSDRSVQFKHAYKGYFRHLVKSILSFSVKEINSILFPWQENVLAVGSVICWGNKQSKIWGSGFMVNKGNVRAKAILAVRGPYTAKRLASQGFPKCEIYGDPALLLPLWLKPAALKKYRIGIIPHWKETEGFIKSYGHKYKIIDLRTNNVETIVKEITSCEYILSTSLHGVIVPHAYSIPALWLKDGYIDTDGFKFLDYFASVGIPEYRGFEDVENILAKEANWMKLFESNQDKMSIGLPLENIQKKLLSVAPFPLKEKYQVFIQDSK